MHVKARTADTICPLLARLLSSMMVAFSRSIRCFDCSKKLSKRSLVAPGYNASYLSNSAGGGKGPCLIAAATNPCGSCGAKLRSFLLRVDIWYYCMRRAYLYKPQANQHRGRLYPPLPQIAKYYNYSIPQKGLRSDLFPPKLRGGRIKNQSCPQHPLPKKKRNIQLAKNGLSVLVRKLPAQELFYGRAVLQCSFWRPLIGTF